MEETWVAGIFGWQRGRIGSIVNISINNTPLSPHDSDIVLLSNPAHARWSRWWAFRRVVVPGDIVRLETKVGVRGVGPDNEKTTTHYFVVEPTHMVEIRIKKVGYKDYPLLKGTLKIQTQQSQQELTEKIIEDFFK